jgi:hypothetical protein
LNLCLNKYKGIILIVNKTSIKFHKN